MAVIRKKLIYTVIQETFSEADKNPNLNYDLTNQQKLLDEIIFANKSLTKDEKAETVRIITESYDYFRIIKNKGESRICENCQHECLATFYCEICIRNYLKACFSDWTSGNGDIDNLIQNCQMETIAPTRIIEWIPYNNFRNIKYLTKGGFSEIYTARWTDGPYDKWDSKKQQLKRFGMLKAILKKLENVESANISWLKEAKSHLVISNKISGVVKCFGLTTNPEGYYMLVLQQMDIGLRKYLQQNHNKLTWKERINIICDIIKALYEIHKEKAIHRNLHSMNILYLQSANLWCISELGFCGPADKSPKRICPYIAPEVIMGKAYSFASDVYSIGMLIWEISSGKPPFNDYKHDFVMKILNGIRPKMVSEIPLEYKQLIEQCWHADPSKRPDIDYLHNKIFEIRNLCYQNGYDKLTFYKYNTNLYQFFQSNKSIRLKTKLNDYILDLNKHYWKSGNEKIDDFVREIQLDIDDFNDVVFEWIPYNQFDEIKEIDKNDSITICSAIWKYGPLYYNNQYSNYTRNSNEKVALKYLHNSQDSINSLINEAKRYSETVNKMIFQVYGISQNPYTNNYIFVLKNLIWASGNEKIDNFIQEVQLKINDCNDIVFEWILYNQFDEIEEIGKNDSITIYSAIWKDGPLYYNNQYSNYTRDSNKKVILKYLHNSQDSINSLINEVKKYSDTVNKMIFKIYGISQNPYTNNYIFVLNNYFWKSGNKKIDNFIQEVQLKINDCNDIVFEWILYNQFDEIKEISKNDSITIYSAIWKDGPLYYNNQYSNYTRDSNKKVTLKYLHNSENSINFLINEINKYFTKIFRRVARNIYGISQYSNTNDYILVFVWTSGSEKIDNFIQEMQLKINDYIVFGWIPYNQLYEIKEIVKNSSNAIYSAIWKDGPLYYGNYRRNPNKKVTLKYLYSSQDSINSLINEANKYSEMVNKVVFQIYGISQNPYTNNYILVLKNLIWASGNKRIDNFIQEINKYNDVIFEWILYNQFDEIKEINKNDSITIYSAIWKDGPFSYNWYKNYTRNSNKKVTLKHLHNSQDSIDSLINEATKYSEMINKMGFQIYGISQNPYTNNYILVLKNLIWASGNERIDNFIQEINKYNDVIFEWILYNQFDEIKEINKNDSITIYSAIWKDGPLYNNNQYSNYTRDSNKKVTLKYLYNSQDSIDFLINEATKYSEMVNKMIFQIYGISQNPYTNNYIFVLNNYFWKSGNKKIDNFIQEMQLKINDYNDIVFEWILYNQFDKIKKMSKNGSITIYSAIWKDGPLYYNNQYSNYTRDSNKQVVLKYLHDSQDSIDYLISKTKKYSEMINKMVFQIYGISQNPYTNDYIIVLNNYFWKSGNEKIDNFIQEMQLKINDYNDVVFEWILYNQFDEIKEISKNDSITTYSAIWKDGPLYYNNQYSNYTRDSNKGIALKYLHNSVDSIDLLINKAKKYSAKIFGRTIHGIYGISQNPNTNNYILVLAWTSGNEIIDNFIQEMQLKINKYEDTVFEWIPYNQFNEIKEIGKNSSYTMYSAIWKDGPLYYNNQYSNYTRNSNKEVALKYLHNSGNSTDFLTNKVKKYSVKIFGRAIRDIHGISQNPNTNNYILVLAWASGNEIIDNFIQEMQLKINKYEDIVFEWIPYNQFDEIKEIGKNSSYTIYSSIWKDGPLYYNNQYSNYTRNLNKEVALKYLHNSGNSTVFLTNKVKKYSAKIFGRAIRDMYGISQDPDTNNYILVLAWASGNKKIDNFIQEMQLKINDYDDIVFEWIPYSSQLNNIKEIGKGGFSTVYSAIWKDGPLEYDADKNIYTNRDPNRVIVLKCLHDSQNITDKFLNEVKEYSINKRSNILNIYGLSQNPYTKDYIMVLDYAKDGNFIKWTNENYEYFNWQDKLSALLNIINGLKEIHQKNVVHRDFHTGNILFLSSIDDFGNCISISDMGLCGEVGNIDEAKIFGVMPYVAPEVLRGKSYTKAADIYSFGMIMYFAATGKQPFYNRAHDNLLALDICNGVRPEINEPEAPRCYIDLMKKCWDLNPKNRPNINEVDKVITSLHKSSGVDIFVVENDEIEMQFKEAEEYRKANLSSIKNYQADTHPQAIYTSRLLNPFTKDLSQSYNEDYESDLLDHVI